MKTTDADVRFRALADERGVDLDGSTPDAGFSVLLDFYRLLRATDVDLAEDGDMMLYEWGTYDWGDGSHFELSLMRQLIRGDGTDDDIFQLRLIYRFAAGSELDDLGSGQSEWCVHPADLDALRGEIESSEPYLALRHAAPLEVCLTHGPVG